MTENQKIYLDVCCLNRPFDDWSQLRIRLEAEAVLKIITNCREGKWLLVGSTALDSEIDRDPDIERKQRVKELLQSAKTKIASTPVILDRTAQLVKLGFKPFDALHLAFAESDPVDVFLTTDDRLSKKALIYQDNLKIHVQNPVFWLMKNLNS